MNKIVSLCFFVVALLLNSCKVQQTKSETYFDIVRPLFSGEKAYETTAYVEQYWRVPGNTGFNNSIYRIIENLEAAGYIDEDIADAKERFVYRLEKRPMENPTWEPIDAELSIVGISEPLLKFETNRSMIYLNASSTPEEGVTAEVVHIESLNDFKTKDIEGKIVFSEMSPYRLYDAAIIEGKALGLITYNNPDYLQPEKNVTSIQFRSMRYKEGIDAWGIALSFQAKEILKNELTKGVVKAKVNIKTKIYSSEELTVVAFIKGTDLTNESLVFSAHVQEPGANDNATGVGTQLEMAMLSAELVKANKIDTKRTLTFLWGDEISSTRRYIEENNGKNTTIKWGISLDMVGENTDVTGGTFLIEKMPDPSAIWTRGKDKHTEWGGRPLKEEDMKPHYLNDFIIGVFKEQGEFANWKIETNPFEGGSDHTPFLKADIPGLLLWHFTDQFYHTDNDRIDKVSQETLKNVGTGALASAFKLLNADKNFGLQLIRLTMNAAKTRLNDEFAISKAAIIDGADSEEQLAILNSWHNWYTDTLDTIKDVEPIEDTELNTAILKAKEELNLFTKSLENKLSKPKN
ncbi:MAG: peptidase M28 [Bacteroidetes bacterium]|nr:MAG: peptidase M28 [Bacteroidota bacterium]